MKIVLYPDPVLFKKAEVVAESLFAQVKLHALEMMRIVLAHGAFGLAAPQVGLSQRFFVVNRKRLKKYCILPVDCPSVFINPEIIAVNAEGSKATEGCLSAPGRKAEVTRLNEITVRCIDGDGTRREFNAKGMLARCIQHEVDHLDGISIFEREREQAGIRSEAAARQMQEIES